MSKTESLLYQTFSRLNIGMPEQTSILLYLDIIKRRDPATYFHSLRVGILGSSMANHLSLNPKPLFYAGLLHDIGKALIDPHILRKTKGFNKKDFEEIKPHPLYGYFMLRDIHDFSAEILLRHHRFGHHPYPKKLPKSSAPYGKKTKKLIEKYARLLALADFYDALTTRKNDKFGKQHIRPGEIKNILIFYNRDVQGIIEELFRKGIFTEIPSSVFAKKEILPYLSLNEEIKNILLSAEHSLNLSERIARNVALAAALEPIPDKPGATTRLQDIKESKALEMFVSGGVNIGLAFSHLADYIQKHRTAESSYQFCYQAMALSKIRRAGGKINQGIIEFLFPIAIAQSMHDPDSRKNILWILEKTKDVLKDTTPADVAWLIKMKRLGNRLSAVEHKYPVKVRNTSNVFNYYYQELRDEEKKRNTAGIIHNRQFVLVYPDVKRGLDAFLKSKEPKFAKRVIEAYEAIRNNPNNMRIGPGLASDFIAIILYLVFSYSASPIEEIIN